MCGSFQGLLIGRTAVHSGKDPAFVAYDQFLSTGILQPLSRGEVRGSFASLLPCPLSCPLSPLPGSCSAADRSYSISSSARASSIGGMSRPSALARLQVDDELKLGWLHDRQVGRLFALEDSDRHRHQPDDGCRSGLFRSSSGPWTATNSRNW